jgi:hypothetical protein
MEKQMAITAIVLVNSFMEHLLNTALLLLAV